MNHFDKLARQIRRYVFSVLLASNLLLLGVAWVGLELYHLPTQLLIAGLALLTLVVTLLLSLTIGRYVTQPVKFLWQAVLHVAPGYTGETAPNLDEAKVGRELVTSLVLQIYQFASNTKPSITGTVDSRANTIANKLPLPMLVMDKNQTIVFANEAALHYLQLAATDVIGKNVYSLLDMSFPSEQTLDTWLNDSRTNKLTATRSWERVRLKLPSQNRLLQFDMAAYYNKENPAGVETIFTMFDHSERYAQDDHASNFVAVAVHELRGPLTVLRGYIEVFEEEFSGKLNEELSGFMRRMQASAQQLASLVNNILNVARLEADQLALQLHEENWPEIIQKSVNDMSLLAQIHQKTIELQIEPGLPTVGVDRVSIYEVLNNLLDNAIKYSGQGPKKIIVKASKRRDGLIETTVRDYGIGIPSSVLPQLFEKFARNYRNQNQISGTGLGLYLSKAIVTAHGGQISVQSKEGEGTAVGFTIQPYSMLADTLKNTDNKDIVRGAHGWIKNHSLYRR